MKYTTELDPAKRGSDEVLDYMAVYVAQKPYELFKCPTCFCCTICEVNTRPLTCHCKTTALPERVPSVVDLAEEVLQVQDACNLSGVAKTFGNATTVLWAHAHALDKGTHWVNQHPIVTAYLSKLVSLNHSDSISRQMDALNACDKLVMNR